MIIQCAEAKHGKFLKLSLAFLLGISAKSFLWLKVHVLLTIWGIQTFFIAWPIFSLGKILSHGKIFFRVHTTQNWKKQFTNSTLKMNSYLLNRPCWFQICNSFHRKTLEKKIFSEPNFEKILQLVSLTKNFCTLIWTNFGEICWYT